MPPAAAARRQLDEAPDCPVEEYWCDATPFREHVAELMRDSGLHWRLIAAQADVAPSAMDRLLHGHEGRRSRYIHVTVARALMQIDVDDLRQAALHRTSVVESRELLEALARLHFTPADLSPWLTPHDLQLRTSHTKYCTTAQAARIQACYDLLTGPSATVSPADLAAS